MTCVMAAPPRPYFSLVHDALSVLSTDEWDLGTPGGFEGPGQLSQMRECCRATQRQHSSFPPASLVTPIPPLLLMLLSARLHEARAVAVLSAGGFGALVPTSQGASCCSPQGTQCPLPPDPLWQNAREALSCVPAASLSWNRAHWGCMAWRGGCKSCHARAPTQRACWEGAQPSRPKISSGALSVSEGSAGALQKQNLRHSGSAAEPQPCPLGTATNFSLEKPQLQSRGGGQKLCKTGEGLAGRSLGSTHRSLAQASPLVGSSS